MPPDPAQNSTAVHPLPTSEADSAIRFVPLHGGFSNNEMSLSVFTGTRGEAIARPRGAPGDSAQKLSLDTPPVGRDGRQAEN